MLKYLNEEDVRKAEYLSKDFHKEIDKINYKELIETYAKVIGKVRTDLIRLDGNRNKVHVSKRKVQRIVIGI